MRNAVYAIWLKAIGSRLELRLCVHTPHDKGLPKGYDHLHGIEAMLEWHETHEKWERRVGLASQPSEGA